MFFTKNETALREEVIKKAIKDKEGKVLLHINISYPAILLKDRNRFKQNAQPFYERSAKKFLHFAENELLERAKKLAVGETFRPLGAVMKYTCAYESKSVVSIYTDISIFDGINEQNQLRSAQVWNKNKGYIYSFNDIFKTETKKYLLERFFSQGNSGKLKADEYKRRLKRFFLENNFYIKGKNAAFFYPANRIDGKQGVKVFFVELKELSEKKLLKISL